VLIKRTPSGKVSKGGLHQSGSRFRGIELPWGKRNIDEYGNRGIVKKQLFGDKDPGRMSFKGVSWTDNCKKTIKDSFQAMKGTNKGKKGGETLRWEDLKKGDEKKGVKILTLPTAPKKGRLVPDVQKEGPGGKDSKSF